MERKYSIHFTGELFVLCTVHARDQRRDSSLTILFVRTERITAGRDDNHPSLSSLFEALDSKYNTSDSFQTSTLMTKYSIGADEEITDIRIARICIVDLFVWGTRVCRYFVAEISHGL